MDAMYRILKQLKGSLSKELISRQQKKDKTKSIEGYIDVDLVGSIFDRCFMSGYHILFLGNLFGKNRNVIAWSSVKPKFRAITHGKCEIIWLELVLEELKVTKELPMKLYHDNKATLSITHNPLHRDRTRHMKIDKHFIKWKMEGTIC